MVLVSENEILAQIMPPINISEVLVSCGVAQKLVMESSRSMIDSFAVKVTILM